MHMATDPQNPYASPQADVTYASEAYADQATLRKIEAIIKDAGQFWLAILMCIFCTGLGAIIIGPWYFVRLIQWNSIARAQPMLLDPAVPRGSLAQRFQSARIKLIIGISFGALIFLLGFLLFVLFVMAMASRGTHPGI
jgi:hypothetical protein